MLNSRRAGGGAAQRCIVAMRQAGRRSSGRRQPVVTLDVLVVIGGLGLGGFGQLVRVVRMLGIAVSSALVYIFFSIFELTTLAVLITTCSCQIIQKTSYVQFAFPEH